MLWSPLFDRFVPLSRDFIFSIRASFRVFPFSFNINVQNILRAKLQKTSYESYGDKIMETFHDFSFNTWTKNFSSKRKQVYAVK